MHHIQLAVTLLHKKNIVAFTCRKVVEQKFTSRKVVEQKINVKFDTAADTESIIKVQILIKLCL